MSETQDIICGNCFVLALYHANLILHNGMACNTLILHRARRYHQQRENATFFITWNIYLAPGFFLQLWTAKSEFFITAGPQRVQPSPEEACVISSTRPGPALPAPPAVPPVSICTDCVTHVTPPGRAVTHLLSGVFYKLYSRHMWHLSVVMPWHGEQESTNWSIP